MNREQQLLTAATLVRVKRAIRSAVDPIMPDVFFDYELQRMIVQLSTETLAERAGYVEVKYPTTWWDHFKQRFFPRWPHNLTTKIIEVGRYYPDIPIPTQRHIDFAHYTEPDDVMPESPIQEAHEEE